MRVGEGASVYWSWRAGSGDVWHAESISGIDLRAFCRGCGRRNRFGGRFQKSISTASAAAVWGSGKDFSGGTVERWFLDWLRRLDAERRSARCPRVLGIDEHFFTRRRGYATTFCDLAKHRVFDVVAGRSEKALEDYLHKLVDKHRVKVICMDLSATYRALARKHFPQARIVADHFHVIRLIGHHFLTCWKQLDPAGARHRGLVSLMRRHQTKSQTRPATAAPGLPATKPCDRCHLWLQTTPLFTPAAQRPQPPQVPPTGSPATFFHRSATPKPSGRHGYSRRYSLCLERRDRHQVALLQKQRHHRRLPHQNRSPPTPSLWLLKLQ